MRDRFPLRFLPVGGLGHIGANAMLVGWGEDEVLLDCGVLFPAAGQVGVDLVLPDLGFLARRGERLRALVLTHGHEDHIGAVPYLLQDHPMPVYGPPFALALLEEKLREHGLAGKVELKPVAAGERFDVGALRFEAFRMTHSIPDTVGYHIGTPVGSVVFTSDFKLEADPIDGQHWDRARLAALGDEGVLALFADSTNVLRRGRSGGEREAAQRLREHIAAWPGRVIVSMFASNLHRLGELYRIARDTGRTFCLVGRSLHSYSEVARRVGRTPFPVGEAVEIQRALELAPERLLLVMTGSQGEPRAALAAASRDDHPFVRVGRDDLVIFSSRVIPGNERAIYGTMDRLVRLGARVLHDGNADVHVSGHAHAEEVAELIRLVRPRFFVPVHGEMHHMAAAAELARHMGVEQALVLTNGDELGLGEEGPRRLDAHDLESHFVAAALRGTAEQLVLRERLRMAWDGLCSVLIELRRDPRGLRVTARVRAAGVPDLDGTVIEGARQHLVEEMEGLPALTPADELAEHAEMLLRRYFRRVVGRKPVVHAFVTVAKDTEGA